MRDGRWLGCRLTLVSAGTMILVGCVTTGRSLDAMRARSTGLVMARQSDVPLVPVPPPPLGRPSGSPVSLESPVPPPPMPPASAPAAEVRPALVTPTASATVVPAVPGTPPAASVTPAPSAVRGASSEVPSSVRAEAYLPMSPMAPVGGNTQDPVSPPAAAAEPAPTIRQLYQEARDRYAGMDSYIARLTRREKVRDTMNPEEVILFRYRKKPWSAYLKWLGKEGQGREVVYVKGQHQDKIHTLLASGDIPFVPAGRRMALAPDNLLVRTACRHPITEAGIGASIERIGTLLDAQQRGDSRSGQIHLVGPVRRPEFTQPVYGLEHVIPPGGDPTLTRGGRRTYFFDPASHLPVLITTRDDRGQEVEYYRFDRLQPSVRLDNADFDPDTLWGKPGAARTSASR